MTRNALIRKLYEMVNERGTQRAVAEYLGVSQIYLSDVLRGKRNPGKSILSKLGLTAQTVYIPQKEA